MNNDTDSKTAFMKDILMSENKYGNAPMKQINAQEISMIKNTYLIFRSENFRKVVFLTVKLAKNKMVVVMNANKKLVDIFDSL